MFIFIFVILVLVIIALFLLYGAEQRANDQRIARGEEPIKHHDCTDYPPPVNVIDWMRKKRH